MEWFRSLMLPPQGSAFAAEVDTLYMFLFWLSVVLFLGIAFAAIPRAAARAKPGAPSRLLITRAISAPGIRPAAMLSASASKFDPRPDNSTPIR